MKMKASNIRRGGFVSRHLLEWKYLKIYNKLC